MEPSTSSGLPIYVWKEKQFQVSPKGLVNLAQGNVCSICSFIYNMPVRICKSDASHLCCLACANELKNNNNNECTLCRGKLLDEFEINEAVATNIKNLSVTCPNRECNQPIDISEIESHMNQCLEEEVTCPGECGEPPLKRRKMKQHKEECNQYMKCECGERILKKESRENGDALKKHIASKPVEKHPLLNMAFRLC